MLAYFHETPDHPARSNLCSTHVERFWGLGFAEVSPDDPNAYWSNCVGTYTFANGATYVGEWLNNKRQRPRHLHLCQWRHIRW
jgi:hypothetical protein